MAQALRKRPFVITFFAGASYLRALVSLGFIMLPSIRRLGDWMPAVYGLLIALHFISLVGVWHMKRWGVWLFMIALFARIIFLMMIDDLSLVGTLLSLVVLIIFLCYYKRMSSDL